MAETTGTLKTLWNKANGSKKKLAEHSATSIATIILLFTLYGDDIKAVKQNVIDTAVVQEAVKGIKEDVENLDKKIDKLLDLQIQSMQKPNTAPRIEKETVVDRYFTDDPNAKAYWKHGAAADTLMLPENPNDSL